MNPDEFHKHLDECEQCEKNPFDLCQAGLALLSDGVAAANDAYFGDDDDDEAGDDCGLMHDGSCSMAGSEQCEFECPNRR